ncbi:MAG: lamin tail domain-containing protein [Deltaproteobacteria bacterium]|nr:lamin tail domain-containing protein [Deltaproteobacteria bacterium]
MVINELLVNPTGTDGGQEWVELYNPGATDITLTGWAFQRGKSSSTPMKTRHTFGATAVIPAGGYYILGDTALTSPTPDEVTTTASTLDLGNGNTNADAVQLLDCDGELIDVIVYGVAPNSDGWTDEAGALVADADLAPEPGEGEVLARVDDGADTNLSATDVCVDTVSTPDAKNRTSCAETVPPDTGDTGIVDTGDTSPPDSGGDSGGGGDSGTTSLCTPGAPGGLVINEVLYDPADDATGEYVELRQQRRQPRRPGRLDAQRREAASAKQLTFAETDEIPAGTTSSFTTAGSPSPRQRRRRRQPDLGNAGSSGDAVRLMTAKAESSTPWSTAPTTTTASWTTPAPWPRATPPKPAKARPSAATPSAPTPTRAAWTSPSATHPGAATPAAAATRMSVCCSAASSSTSCCQTPRATTTPTGLSCTTPAAPR